MRRAGRAWRRSPETRRIYNATAKATVAKCSEDRRQWNSMKKKLKKPATAYQLFYKEFIKVGITIFGKIKCYGILAGEDYSNYTEPLQLIVNTNFGILEKRKQTPISPLESPGWTELEPAGGWEKGSLHPALPEKLDLILPNVGSAGRRRTD